LIHTDDSQPVQGKRVREEMENEDGRPGGRSDKLLSNRPHTLPVTELPDPASDRMTIAQTGQIGK